MAKKILTIVIGTLMSLSLVSCGFQSKVESTSESNNAISIEESYDKLEGTWAENITSLELTSKYNELLKKVEDKTKQYGLKYTKEEDVVKGEGDKIENSSYIYLDQKDPEKNRMESLYFGITFFGQSKETGQIVLKTSLNFDGDLALKDSDFDFGKTALASYGALLTGDEDRDYSDINTQIKNVLESESGEGIIKNSIDGLYEEFTVSKDCIVYRLETKKFDFLKGAETIGN